MVSRRYICEIETCKPSLGCALISRFGHDTDADPQVYLRLWVSNWSMAIRYF